MAAHSAILIATTMATGVKICSSNFVPYGSDNEQSAKGKTKVMSKLTTAKGSLVALKLSGQLTP